MNCLIKLEIYQSEQILHKVLMHLPGKISSLDNLYEWDQYTTESIYNNAKQTFILFNSKL